MKALTNKRIHAVVPLITLLICSILYLSVSSQATGNIVVNEVAFKMTGSGDWIELYNPTLSNMSLGGMSLSDDMAELDKYEFPNNLIIPTGGYVTIYAKNAEPDSGSYQTDFNISLGETIYLIDRDGSTIIDKLPVISSDEVTDNKTIGRFPDGSNNIYLMGSATPGQSNTKDTEL